MKNKELFDKTVSILVKAYFEGTLRHTDPCGCAVGNLIAFNNNYKIVGSLEDAVRLRWKNQIDSTVKQRWCSVHICGDFTRSFTEFDSKRGHLDDATKKKRLEIGVKQLKSTGYTPTQTALIERAFEIDWELTDIGDGDSDGFKGLMAVVDVLQEIHECTDEERDTAKQMFVKA
jgi:hypothetical protein